MSKEATMPDPIEELATRLRELLMARSRLDEQIDHVRTELDRMSTPERRRDWMRRIRHGLVAVPAALVTAVRDHPTTAALVAVGAIGATATTLGLVQPWTDGRPAPPPVVTTSPTTPPTPPLALTPSPTGPETPSPTPQTTETPTSEPGPEPAEEPAEQQPAGPEPPRRDRAPGPPEDRPPATTPPATPPGQPTDRPPVTPRACALHAEVLGVEVELLCG